LNTSCSLLQDSEDLAEDGPEDGDDADEEEEDSI
jgi:hypothetical protein